MLGIPCLTLRDNTERPATIEYGTNLLAGTRRDQILRAWKRVLESPKRSTMPPLWDGETRHRCHAVLKEYFAGRTAPA